MIKNRFMRIIAIFDLPVITKEEKEFIENSLNI